MFHIHVEKRCFIIFFDIAFERDTKTGFLQRGEVAHAHLIF